MFYDRKIFLQLVPHVQNSNSLKDAVDRLHKANGAEYDRRKGDIDAAARDAKAISVALESDPDSMAYKIAAAFLADAQAELEAAKEAAK